MVPRNAASASWDGWGRDAAVAALLCGLWPGQGCEVAMHQRRFHSVLICALRCKASIVKYPPVIYGLVGAKLTDTHVLTKSLLVCTEFILKSFFNLSCLLEYFVLLSRLNLFISSSSWVHYGCFGHFHSYRIFLTVLLHFGVPHSSLHLSW